MLLLLGRRRREPSSLGGFGGFSASVSAHQHVVFNIIFLLLLLLLLVFPTPGTGSTDVTASSKPHLVLSHALLGRATSSSVSVLLRVAKRKNGEEDFGEEWPRVKTGDPVWAPEEGVSGVKIRTFVRPVPPLVDTDGGGADDDAAQISDPNKKVKETKEPPRRSFEPLVVSQANDMHKKGGKSSSDGPAWAEYGSGVVTSTPASGPGSSDAVAVVGSEGSAFLLIDKLLPDTLYEVVFSLDDEVGGSPAEGARPHLRVRTFPPRITGPGESGKVGADSLQRARANSVAQDLRACPRSVRFGWSSCLLPRDLLEGRSVFRELARRDYDFFLFLGDTIYADNPVAHDPDAAYADPAFYMQRYNEIMADPELQHFARQVPSYSTWDDHEFVNDYSGGQDTPMYRNARGAFDFWMARRNPEPHNTRPSPSGFPPLYYNFTVCDTSVFVLDCRSHRSPNSWDRKAPKKTMLGEKQFQRLAAWLREDPATTKIIASSVMVTELASLAIYNGNQYLEGWFRFPDSRRRMLEAIHTEVHPRTAALHFVSADSHWPLVANLSRFGGLLPSEREFPDVLEFSASPLAAFPLPLGDGLQTIRTKRQDEGIWVSELNSENSEKCPPDCYPMSLFGEMEINPHGDVTAGIYHWLHAPQEAEKLFAFFVFASRRHIVHHMFYVRKFLGRHWFMWVGAVAGVLAGVFVALILFRYFPATARRIAQGARARFFPARPKRADLKM